jgi:hypothetical protein
MASSQWSEKRHTLYQRGAELAGADLSAINRRRGTATSSTNLRGLARRACRTSGSFRTWHCPTGSPIQLNNFKGLTIMKESGLDDRQQDKDDKIS